MDINALFSGSLIADLVLAVMFIEAVVVVAYSPGRVSRRLLSPLVAGLLPGFFLVLALRAALVQASWYWIASALLGALITHLVDLRLRVRAWQQQGAAVPNRH